MRKLLIVFLVVLGGYHAKGQDNRFIYIQSENHQPFYARINAKTFKASGDGNLLVSGLSQNNYQLHIGWGEQPGPEWKFNCDVTAEDLAYTLKKNGKGAELIPLGAKTGITGTREEAKTEKKATTASQLKPGGVVSDDIFSIMLAGVVNDPSIRDHSALIPREALAVLKEQPAVDSMVAKDTLLVSAAPIKATNAADSADKATANLSNDLIAALSTAKKDSTVALNTPVKKNGKLAKKEGKQKAAAEESPVNSAAATPETFVIKETRDSLQHKTTTEAESVKDNKSGKAVTTETVAVSSQEKNREPILNARKDSAVTNSSTEPFVVKEVKDAAVDKSKEPTPVTAEKKPASETFVVKEVKDVEKNKKTDPVTVKPLEEKPAPPATKTSGDPFVIREIVPAAKPTTADASSDNSPVVKETARNTGNSSIGVSASIKKTLQRKSANGIEMIYIDESINGSRDTIRILIPAL